LNAIDKDVGTWVLPADNTVITVTNCQAVDLQYECITPIRLQNTGSLCVESGEISGLRAEVSYSLLPPQSGINDDILSYCRDRHGTRLKESFNLYQPRIKALSTSNGGIGY